ncbi:hypothetical protein JD844_012511 [Phrynosoma platyrhinos]|uniref:Amino acid transporter transmembrane domain-containing protein n=1 Tax=Phrynosoma platyrhinos TaxID=52577 RepID=A0ABQ7TKJ1_PHRPL|nr:hypothetical protein JD844_012511 [Phrynosoma platyrhinos]
MNAIDNFLGIKESLWEYYTKTHMSLACGSGGPAESPQKMKSTGLELSRHSALNEFLLTAVALLSSYSIHLLLKSSGIVGIRAYEQDWYMNGNYLVIMVSVSIILPLALMKQLGYLGYASGFSLSCMVFFLISVIYKKFQVPCPLSDRVNATTNQNYTPASTSSYQNDPMVIQETDEEICSASLFTLNSQNHIITDKRSTVIRKQAQAALFSPLCFCLQCSSAPVNMADGQVESELLHTYNRVDPFDVLILCVRVAVLTAVTLTVPIVLFPVRRAIQQMLFQDKEFCWIRHTIIAVVLLTSINLLVIFAPSILGIFGLIGATSAPCLIFIFPAIFYIRIMPKETEPTKSPPKILAALFACLGVLFMIMSLSFIITDWASGGGKSGGSH